MPTLSPPPAARRPRALALLPALLGLLALPAAQGQAPRYTLTDLGRTGGPASPGTDLGSRVAYFPDTVALNGAGQAAYSVPVLDSGQNLLGTQAALYSGGAVSLLGNFGAGSGGGGDASVAALNSAGQAAGESDVYDAGHTRKGRHAFLSVGGALTDLGTLGTDSGGFGFSAASAVNDSGQVVGESDVYDAGHVSRGTAAFLYSRGRMIRLGSLGTDSQGDSYAQATAINAAGVVVGSSNVYDAAHTLKGGDAFVYANGVMTDLGSLSAAPPGSANSSAAAINAAGLVVGTSSVYAGSAYQGFEAFLYAGGGLVRLGDFGNDGHGSAYSSAAAVNDAGQIVGSSQIYDAAHVNKGLGAFLYANGVMTNLGSLSTDTDGMSTTAATGLNNAGQVIGFYSRYDAPNPQTEEAFLYSGGALYDLRSLIANGTGWSGLQATAINDAGQIAGSGTYNGQREAFLLTPQASHTHLLWNNSDGRVMLWSVAPDGSFTLNGFGPYTDGAPNNKWSATAVATGTDGVSHLLWNNTDGRVMLWTVDDQGNFSLAGYGPYTDNAPQNKWSAVGVSVGPDNTVHLLWSNTDHRAMLWNVDSSFNFTLAGYGPYTDNAPQNLWSATALATGPDNKSHLLWTNTDNRVMLWDVAPDFTFTLAGYGPYTDNAPQNLWSAVGVSVGPDNVQHILWTNTDRRAMFWNVNPDFYFTLAGYGPYTDNAPGNLWSAQAVATGPDGLSHILWANTDYRAMLWGVDNAFNFTVAGYGPYTDNTPGNLWSATAVSAGP